MSCGEHRQRPGPCAPRCASSGSAAAPSHRGAPSTAAQARGAATPPSPCPKRPCAGPPASAGGSLNDAVLTVLADILAEQAAQRGEDLDPVVVSVPVAVRAGSTGSRAGRGDGAATNAVGVMPTPVPTRGPITDRIAAVAAWRHARLDRDGTRGASLPLVLAAFRIVHALHLVRWYTDRQRLVTTFATALPGPALPVTLLGTPVTRITPLVLNQGNTTIAFATITYAGQLTIGVVADPTCGPDPVDVGEVPPRTSSSTRCRGRASTASRGRYVRD